MKTPDAGLVALWETAARLDPTLKLPATAFRALGQKRILPIHFSRQRLFEGMLQREVRLFHSVPVRIRTKRSTDTRTAIVQLIRRGFPKSAKARVQTGASRTRRTLSVGRLMDRWEGGRAIISVTDLHIRGTKFGRAVDTSVLSDFNFLASKRGSISIMEMLTVLVGSEGNVTDSHTDDCDGSNHCFIGQKLWLMWDRLEGQAAGFEDEGRDRIVHRAAFDMRTFLSLPSARWLLIGPGETLFLPGNMSHKVLTIAHYIGVGSFYLAFPNSLSCFTRWALDGTVDINQSSLLDKMIKATTRKLAATRHLDNETKKRWGWNYLREAANCWNRLETPGRQKRILQNPNFNRFLQAVAKEFSGHSDSHIISSDPS